MPFWINVLLSKLDQPKLLFYSSCLTKVIKENLFGGVGVAQAPSPFVWEGLIIWKVKRKSTRLIAHVQLKFSSVKHERVPDGVMVYSFYKNYITRDPTDPILDTSFSNVPHAHGTSRGWGMSHNGSQNKETSCSSTWVGKILVEDFCCLQDEIELLDRYCPTSSTRNISNSQFVMFTNLYLFYLTWLIFCSSACHQSWKTEKITLHDMHTI